MVKSPRNKKDEKRPNIKSIASEPKLLTVYYICPCVEHLRRSN